jgi:hypothetical protein
MSAATAATQWREVFGGWPAELPRRGVLVTSYNEQIPFDGFASSPTMLLIDRSTPDSLGARKVLLPYENVVAVKFTDVIKNKSFAALGFVVTPAKA